MLSRLGVINCESKMVEADDLLGRLLLLFLGHHPMIVSSSLRDCPNNAFTHSTTIFDQTSRFLLPFSRAFHLANSTVKNITPTSISQDRRHFSHKLFEISIFMVCGAFETSTINTFPPFSSKFLKIPSLWKQWNELDGSE